MKIKQTSVFYCEDKFTIVEPKKCPKKAIIIDFPVKKCKEKSSSEYINVVYIKEDNQWIPLKWLFNKYLNIIKYRIRKLLGCKQ